VLTATTAANAEEPAAKNPFSTEAQEAAKEDISHLVSNILAASLCDNVKFNGGVIEHLVAESMILRELWRHCFLPRSKKTSANMKRIMPHGAGKQSRQQKRAGQKC
jgi:hypothetical protein